GPRIYIWRAVAPPGLADGEKRLTLHDGAYPHVSSLSAAVPLLQRTSCADQDCAVRNWNFLRPDRTCCSDHRPAPHAHHHPVGGSTVQGHGVREPRRLPPSH